MEATPATSDRVDELVRQWQERFDRGENPAVAELCRDCPELIPDVESRVRVLRHFARLVAAKSPDEHNGNQATGEYSGAKNLEFTRGWDGRPTDADDVPIVPPEYELLGKLGAGGMGVVYKVRQIALNRVEVLKMIRAGEFAGPRDLARFRFEAEAAARLEHPNIVPVYGVGEAAGRPYLAMRWIDGPNLSARRPKEPRAVAAVVAKIARAVHHAHQRGILHRDLKPANILIDPNGEPFVTDFGVARRLDGEAGLSQSGGVVGTPQYMAPEQARGDPNLTVAADVYALGGILYYCLAGSAPFEAKTFVDVLNQVVSDPPPAPHRANPDVDPELEAVCLKCLEKAPADRYPTAAAVADELESYLRGEGVSARAPGLFDWLCQLWRAQPQPSYSWEVLVWFGLIMLVAHAAVFGIVRGGGTVGWVWLANGLCWAGVCWVIYWYMAHRFRRLPPAERHNMMIALGHSLGSVALTCAVVPFDLFAPASAALPVYPPLLALSGLGFFVVGSTHWSRFFPIGLATMALAPVAAVWLDGSPLLYGIATALTLWFWAYSKKAMFSGHGGHGS